MRPTLCSIIGNCCSCYVISFQLILPLKLALKWLLSSSLITKINHPCLMHFL